MNAQLHVRWPADRLFWSVLEAPVWNRAGVLPLGLWPAFEDDCPVSASELHAVCAPIGEGRLLVCAARRDDLAQVAPTVLSVIPEVVPEFGSAATARSLNLLIGSFEPAMIARTRRRTHLVTALTLAAVFSLTVFGFERRAERQVSSANDSRRVSAQLLSSHSPDNLTSLRADVARLRSLTKEIAQLESAPDVTEGLAAILNGWPAACSAQTRSISIGAGGTTIVAVVEGDASDFIRGFRLAAGWTMDEPQMSRIDSKTRLTMHLRRERRVAP